MRRALVIAGLAVAFAAIGIRAAVKSPLGVSPATKAADERDVVRIEQKMPPLDGNNLTATIVEVIYPPGVGSPAHSHPCPVIGYVIDGTIESQVDGGPVRRYEAGETFYEPPNGVHAVSRNPRADKQARLLAYLLCDKPGPLTVPVKPKGGEK